MDRTPPQNLEAEASLIGAAMYSSEAFGTAVAHTSPEDFHRPAHGLIREALGRLWDRGHRETDPVLVAQELGLENLEQVGGGAELTALMANAPSAGNAIHYASVITESAARRRLIAVGLAIQEQTYEESDVNVAMANARSALDRVALPSGSVEPSQTAREFMKIQVEHNWLIPGLIERQDRLMVTAAPGVGKSTLLRQLGIQGASGVHPFGGPFFDPIRVLLIDCENSFGQIQRQLSQLLSKAGENLVDDNFRIEARTQGLDLMERHDTQWLFGKVAANKPDLVILGPLYKMSSGEPKDELPARHVSRIFDEIRARYGCALFIEAHVPKGAKTLQPFGASLWLRWPEFGYGIKRIKASNDHFKFEEWRGPRESRKWPEKIKRGGDWHWTAVEARTNEL